MEAGRRDGESSGAVWDSPLSIYYSSTPTTFIDSLLKAIHRFIIESYREDGKARYSLTMASQRAAEKRLGAAIFIPPKSVKENYALLQALSVEAKNGGTEFNSINHGITKEFIEKKMPGKIQELEDLLASAKTAEPEAFTESIHFFDAKNGSLGSAIQKFFNAKVEVNSSSDSGHVMAMTGMEWKSLPPTDTTTDFLEDCLLAFCESSAEIRSTFSRKPTRFSGNIEYGLAFVTTSIVGTVHVQEDGAFHAGASLHAGAEGLEADGTAMIGGSEQKKFIGKGIIGVHTYFFHLVKTIKKPTIRIKDQFPIMKSHDEQLQYLLGTMASKIRRKVTGPKPPTSRGLLMMDGYETSGDYRRGIANLEELADEEAAFRRDEVSEAKQMASLRIVGESNDDQKQSSGDIGDRYTRSNNVLYTSSFEDLMRIYEAIKDNGTINIQGKVVDAIKPVLQGEISDSLPIIYEEELSGAPPCGSVPGWVLRADPHGKLLMLWGVSGLNGNSGIVSAYDENDWHVRESIEYVEKADAKLIEDLKLEGFFQLHPDEADPEEVDPSQVKNGSVMMMGRHVLALKYFNAHDEAEDEDVSNLHQASLASGVLHSASTSTVPETSSRAGILPVVTNAGTDQTPPRKKLKSEEAG